MIEYLCRHLQTKAFVVTEIEDKRRVPAGELGEIFKRYATCPVYVKADVKDAVACAYEMRTKETYIYCIGSLTWQECRKALQRWRRHVKLRRRTEKIPAKPGS